MTQYADLDPFNHGTATINYEQMLDGESSHLATILNDGWGKDGDIQRISAGAEKSSNNFRVETDSDVYLLKHSHINNTEDQDLINRAIIYLQDNGVKTSTIIPSIAGTSFHLTKEGVFCLYDFIEGENFDGSRTELNNVALEIGRLHKALATIPYESEIRKLNGSVVSHNRNSLEKLMKAIKEHGEQTELDSYVLGSLDELDELSQAIVEAKLDCLPSQIIHYDLHPHNVLFDGSSKELLAILDFDPLKYSPMVGDLGFGMHRFARTCGAKTEKKNDVGVDIRGRARLFLDSYLTENELTDEEIRTLPLAIQDKTLRTLMLILGNHYLRDDTTWSFDIPKQITTLWEGGLFSF
jgi:Ser/Thr protein kinase RdoA (MazF antagonist)